MPEHAILYLLQGQRQRNGLERRSVVVSMLASLGLGLLMAWLLGRVSVLPPVTALSALGLLWLVRAMNDGGTLHQLLAGGSWREIRLSRLSSEQVVDGILIHGFLLGLPWAVGFALFVEVMLQNFWGLIWLGTLLVGSLLASGWGMLTQVQRLVPVPVLSGRSRQLLGGLALALAAFLHAGCPWEMLVVPGLLWLAMGLRCLVAGSLDRIAEGTTFELGPDMSSRRVSWVAWDDNPIVARECARESRHLGGGGLNSLLYFCGWGLVLGLMPLVFVGLSYGVAEVWPDWILKKGTLWLAAYLLLVGWLQSLRATHRVFRALAEERDRRTLDVLLTTSLQPQDFVDGWAQVGYVTRQLEVALVSLICLGCAFCWGPDWLGLAQIAYAALLALGLCQMGAYSGLLLGFRHCARQKRKRDLIFPLVLLGVALGPLALADHPWDLWAVQAGLTYLVLRSARRQALAFLQS